LSDIVGCIAKLSEPAMAVSDLLCSDIVGWIAKMYEPEISGSVREWCDIIGRNRIGELT
jgi:hypothetical protein